MEGKTEVGWLTLIIVTLSIFTIVIDKTFMNVAIYTLIRDLHTTIATIQSIIAIYALTMASLMLLGGKIQNVLGRKKTFLTGAVIYGVGAVVAATSINSTMLLLGWSLLEGVGAALMLPATTSIISGSYEGERRAFALGIISSMASGAGTVGPIIGGFLTTYYSWRYAFALELVVIIAILLFSREISRFPPVMKWSDIDVSGAVISGLGIFILVMGTLLLNDPKNWYLVPYFIAGGLILLIIFYFSQKRRINENKQPLLDITLFKDLTFTLGNITRLIMNFVIGGVLFVIPVYVQSVLGANPLITGLSLIPMSIGIFVMSFTAGKISTRLQPRYILSLGFLSSLVGSVYLTLIINIHVTIVQMIPGIVLLGVGMGIVFPHSANAVFSVARREQQPDASGVLNTGINLGSSLGTAILGVVLILGGFGGLLIEGGNHSYFESHSQPIDSANIGKVNAMKDSFNLVTVVLLIGLVGSLLIPLERKAPEKVRDEAPCPI